MNKTSEGNERRGPAKVASRPAHASVITGSMVPQTDHALWVETEGDTIAKLVNSCFAKIEDGPAGSRASAVRTLEIDQLQGAVIFEEDGLLVKLKNQELSRKNN